VSVRGLEIFVRERGNGFPLLPINGIGANVAMMAARSARRARIRAGRRADRQRRRRTRGLSRLTAIG
jgi:hypothetical protein